MKRVLALITLLSIILLPAQSIGTSTHIEYNINLASDGSATWKIIQVTDINWPIDSLEQFQHRLIIVVNMAKANTTRNMTIDMESLEIKTNMHWETSSQTIQYLFRWENFSITTNGVIMFGDIFSDSIFASLYGNGELYVTYPPQYKVNSAAPHPDEQNYQTQTLHWYRTQDFPTTNNNIKLTKNNIANNLPLTTIVILVTATIAAISTGFLLLNHRRIRKQSPQLPQPLPIRDTQDNKEKITQLLKNEGGKIKQSEICTKLRFSRAKTSLLLAEMEKNNQVRRDKKGKNKIVYIIK